jgi:hypothetical protein
MVMTILAVSFLVVVLFWGSIGAMLRCAALACDLLADILSVFLYILRLPAKFRAH